tara:strand:+ start:3587 stop:4483 length:897 start_codon:yes stop_codon:yes gene_type:complete
MNNEHILNKRQLRDSFERASAGYEEASMLQREVSDRMLSRLDYIKCDPHFILDAGSGTGYGGRKLAHRYPKGRILALDLALSMHYQARPMVSSWWRKVFSTQKNSTNYVCGDIEQLPIRDSSIDLVWSNLSLQWCNNIEHTFSEMYRVLESEGLFMFSTFGPDTLHELRQAFLSMDDNDHINHFTDMHDIGDILVHSGFDMPVMDMEYITLTYDDLVSVMRELKAMGAHNVLQDRKRGLTGKVGWKKVLNNYESFRKNGKLPVTFELVYGHAWKSGSKKDIDGQNIIEFDPKERLIRD